MLSIKSFTAADYAVLGTSGAVVLASLLTALFTLPWRCCRWQAFEAFNTYWKGKILLELILSFWAALQILRLALLWGPYSIVAPESVTSWTGAGWLCRIYLTAALGIAAPLSSWFFLFLLTAGKPETEQSTLSLASKYYVPTTSSQHQHPVNAYTFTPERDISNHTSHRGTPSPSSIPMSARGGSGRGPSRKVGRAFLFAVLCTLPITLLQTGAAWVSVWVTYDGVEIEKQPRTLIGYFLATFWYGTQSQCDLSNTDADTDTTNSTPPPPSSTCTLCTFPAASAIIHLLWTLIFLFSLWTVTSRLAATALNKSLQSRLRLLVILYTTFAAIGCACVGVSVVEEPFTWINQSVWLGYVATVAATALLISWEVVVVPTHSSHVAARRALEWEQGGSSGQLTYAQAVVAAPDFPPYSYPCPLQQNVQQLSSLTNNGNDVNGTTSFEEASAPPFPFTPVVAPYCHVELATQPPNSATITTNNRKSSRSRLFSRSSRASSSRMGGSDDGSGGGENFLITARDVLAVDTSDTGIIGGGGIHGIASTVLPPSPFMTPTTSQHRVAQRPAQQYARSESPGSQLGLGHSPSVASLQLASYYQPHWQQQQQQRGLSSRPLTASSSAPPSTVSPVYQSYGGGAMARSMQYSSGGLGTGAGGGGGLFSYGNYNSVGGGGGRYHNPSSSFGRSQEQVLGTPTTSSGTATPTPQSRQQPVLPPWH